MKQVVLIAGIYLAFGVAMLIFARRQAIRMNPSDPRLRLVNVPAFVYIILTWLRYLIGGIVAGIVAVIEGQKSKFR